MNEKHKITLQEIFNRAWQKFIVEEAPPATVDKGQNIYSCQFLTPTGGRCAVGLALPMAFTDEEIREIDARGGGFGCVVKEFPDRFDIACPEKTERGREEWFSEFQCLLHDDHVVTGLRTEAKADFCNGWKVTTEELKEAYLKVAADYNLEVPDETS